MNIKKYKRRLIYMVLLALIGLSVDTGKSVIKHVLGDNIKPDTISRIDQKIKADLPDHSNLLANNGNGNLQIQQTGEKSRIDIRLNSPTVYYKVKAKAKPGEINVSFNSAPKNVVIGTVNGQNGDNYYNSDFEMSQPDLNYLLTELEKYRRDSGITGKTVNLCLAQGSNGQKVLMQLDTFLQRQGYNTAFPFKMATHQIDGINLSSACFSEEGLSLIIGYLQRL